MSEIPREAECQPDGSDMSEPVSVLHPLADELMAIAMRLREAATNPVDVVADRPRPPRSPNTYLVLARKAYALRRKRATIFGNPDLFGEPA